MATPPRSVLRDSLHRALLRPRLTSRSGSTPSPFQARGEISPGKTAFRPCTTAGSTPPRLGHESFAVHGPLALLGAASIRFLFIGPQVTLHASLPTVGRPPAVALRFARRDQLTEGLTPSRTRPCWAHHEKGAGSLRPPPFSSRHRNRLRASSSSRTRSGAGSSRTASPRSSSAR